MMDNRAIRPWYRIHRSTLVVLAIALACLVFINVPGDRSERESRFYHGWPYWYFERVGDEWDFWSFKGRSTKFHLGALLLNVAAAFCIVALVACPAELWIRRYGRLWRFSVTALLAMTALVAAVTGLVMRDVREGYRQQQTVRELSAFGTVSTRRELRKYDWFRSLFGDYFAGTVTRIEFSASQPVEYLPDLSRLQDLEYVRLKDMTRIPENIGDLAKLPKIKFVGAQLNLTSAEATHRLALLSELPVLKSLELKGDDVNDASVIHLKSRTRISHLNLNSPNITSRSFEELGKLSSLRSLRFEGADFRGSDFSPLGESPELNWLYFVGCKLTPQDEDKLRRLWPDADVQVTPGPNVYVSREDPSAE